LGAARIVVDNDGVLVRHFDVGWRMRCFLTVVVIGKLDE
jgi:hypothetical protein